MLYRNFYFAFIFAVLLNLPAIYAFAVGDYAFYLSYFNVDEYSYLERASFLADAKNPAAYYHELNTDYSYYHAIANNYNALLDILAGVFKKLIGGNLLLCNFLLDFICSIIGFLVYTHFFYKFYKHHTVARITAFAFLLTVPLAFENLFRTQISDFLLNTFVYHGGSAPILRSVYTQFSIIHFGLCLIIFNRYLDLQRLPSGWHIVSGLVLGSAIYMYIFEWLAVAGLLVTLIFVSCLFNKESLATKIKVFIKLLIGFLMAATPGLFIIFLGRGGLQVAESPMISKYWFFAPELLFIAVVFLIVTLKSKNSFVRKASAILCCLYIFQLGAMNLQPILGQLISPTRILQFYIIPLRGALLALLFLNFSLSFKRKLAFNAMAVTIVMVALVGRIHNTNFLISNAYPITRQIYAIAEYINANTARDAVIATHSTWLDQREMPKKFSWSILPNMITALTDRKVLVQNWIFPKEQKDKDNLKREMLTYWLFKGEVNTYWDCPSEIEYPGDIYDLTWIANTLIRNKMCSEHKEYIEKAAACDLLSEYKVDYILQYGSEGYYGNRTFNKRLDSLVGAQKIWEEASSGSSLYKFSREVALASYCE